MTAAHFVSGAVGMLSSLCFCRQTLAQEVGPMPSMKALDEAYAFRGLHFNAPLPTSYALSFTVSGFGKRWHTTKIYQRKADTVTFGGQKIAPDYWFRLNQFEGVTFQLKNEDKQRPILAYLTRLYGKPRAGNVPGAYYWLGTRTYILYEDVMRHVTTVHIASLTMLNEQVIETSVRQEARTTLGWQPDSVGLPRQFPLNSKE